MRSRSNRVGEAVSGEVLENSGTKVVGADCVGRDDNAGVKKKADNNDCDKAKEIEIEKDQQISNCNSNILPVIKTNINVDGKNNTESIGNSNIKETNDVSLYINYRFYNICYLLQM